MQIKPWRKKLPILPISWIIKIVNFPRLFRGLIKVEELIIQSILMKKERYNPEYSNKYYMIMLNNA
ncbi:hypothetical protein ACFL6W_08805 [Thermodesulfobacteriota bacterium]